MGGKVRFAAQAVLAHAGGGVLTRVRLTALLAEKLSYTIEDSRKAIGYLLRVGVLDPAPAPALAPEPTQQSLLNEWND